MLLNGILFFIKYLITNQFIPTEQHLNTLKHRVIDEVLARKQLLLALNSIRRNVNFKLEIPNICRICRKLKKLKLNSNFELLFRLLRKQIASKLDLLPAKELLVLNGSLPVVIVDTILAKKMESTVLNRLQMGLNGKQSLSELLISIYQKQRQSSDVYEMKVHLRQKIYSLLSKALKEKIDLYLIGSSLTGLGSNTSDTDFCLIIYDTDDQIDKKYEDKTNVITKLKELSEIFETNGLSVNPQVIPALVPILKFIETGSGTEVNINLNRIVTIRNTHLLHIYSQMDGRVAPLIVTIKLWARKNGINSAFNKSLTSYSIALMAIYFLQSVCQPPVIPCLHRDYSELFVEDVTALRLTDHMKVKFKTKNIQELGQLFTQFLEYFSLYFPFDKVISVRTGTLIDRSLLVAKNESISGKLWQWKCHICIEEPFDRTNTSHAVHECRMFRHILYSLMQTYQRIKSDELNAKHFL